MSGCVQYYCSTWDSFFRYVRAERPSLWGQLWVFLKVGAPSPCQFEGERGKKNAFSQEYVGQAKLWLLLFFLLVSALFCVNPEEEYFFFFFGADTHENRGPSWIVVVASPISPSRCVFPTRKGEVLCLSLFPPQSHSHFGVLDQKNETKKVGVV